MAFSGDSERKPLSDFTELLRGFVTPAKLDDEDAQARRSEQSHLDKSRSSQIADITSKLKHRRIFVLSMIGLLFIQNAAMFYLVRKALFMNALANTQPIFSVYAGATLIETGYVIRSIVRSVFGRIDYPHSHEHSEHTTNRIQVSNRPSWGFKKIK
jgi:hypothetical protein